MSDVIVSANPPILHREDESTNHLKFIDDNTREQLELMKKGASKALVVQSKVRKKTKEEYNTDDLMLAAQSMGDSINDFGDDIGELKKTVIEQQKKEAADKGLAKTKKLLADTTDLVKNYSSDVQKFAAIGFKNNKMLENFVAKRQKEITNTYDKLKQTIFDAMS